MKDGESNSEIERGKEWYDVWDKQLDPWVYEASIIERGYMAPVLVDGPSSHVSIGAPAPTLAGLGILPLVEGRTPMLTGSPVAARVSPVEGGTPMLAGSPVTAGVALRD